MPNALPKAVRRTWIDVGDGHQLHVALYGNPEGIPLLYLHGGPGAGCSVEELKLFDLSIYQVILLDQRGAGRSRPRGELKHNNLSSLLADIERVRCWLNVPQWMLAGGSFGATLALLYSACYPNRVISQVLWGLFVPNSTGIEWLYGNSGAARLFKEEYTTFTKGSKSPQPLKALFADYRSRLEDECQEVRHSAAERWLSWEMALAYPGCMLGEVNVPFSQSLASIELYYVANEYFGAFEKLIVQLPLIQCQTRVLQGEMDWVCPFKVLQNFFKARASQLIEVTEIKGGYHALADVKMARAVIDAIQEMAKQ
ncbi:alpha/beta fold hydrolase [Shewanella schlegeliana]|uniref:Proline iminopeptidase n=1 Tax=Shewanella schlegeliana TaxID=190308 RepID=A0ABS1T181_9GAMM|nr:alpha/beta fold hydrolase [Shewanella schlegeliana]MBL4914528.1 alpha/beta fold hydrolase [Shewanella schlegeliana]MCL1109656.1 alpha/beta fold hydrolase [Shewanella schlegeliana]GIU30107.1 alpha/beta hydrolase [Shewanella schlegeliana]